MHVAHICLCLNAANVSKQVNNKIGNSIVCGYVHLDAVTYRDSFNFSNNSIVYLFV